MTHRTPRRVALPRGPMLGKLVGRPGVRIRRRYLWFCFLLLDLLVVATISFLSHNSSRGSQATGGSRVASASGVPRAATAAPTAAQGISPPPTYALAAQELSPLSVPISAGIAPSPGPMTGSASLIAKVEIVWLHDGASLSDANLANITAYVMTAPGVPLPCGAQPVVRLWRAQEAQPAHPIAVGQKRMLTTQGHTFSVWDFNDVDVSAARDPANRLKFFVTVDGNATRHNIWIHGADSRTLFPQVDVPIKATNQRPAAVEARIEVLWPHGNLPPEQARQANITAYLFDAHTHEALSPGLAWHPLVRVHWSLNNDADQGPASSIIGKPRTVVTPNGLQLLAWDFNDIDVSPALDPLNKMHFWITVDGTPTFSNIWTYGAVAATIYPVPELLDSCR